jgi:hypothetical protein
MRRRRPSLFIGDPCGAGCLTLCFNGGRSLPVSGGESVKHTGYAYLLPSQPRKLIQTLIKTVESRSLSCLPSHWNLPQRRNQHTVDRITIRKEKLYMKPLTD